MNRTLPEAITGRILATPNPVPAEAGARATLQWEVSTPEGGEVYVSESGAPEKLVARGRNGTMELEWIQAGSEYLFRLYSRTEPRQMLDSVVVQRSVIGRIRASPNPVPPEAGPNTLLEWEITAPAVAEIYVSENAGNERLVCRGASGSFEFGGLQGGLNYVFTLCTATEPRQILDSTVVHRPISGRIRASPNPVPLEAQAKTLLQWEITAPAVAEIYVSENGKTEKLVCRGATGSVELEGLQCGNDYVVTLRTATEPRRNLDTITVRRMDIPWKFLLAELSRYLDDPKFPELFRLWEKHGLHITPVHFYQPIPDTQLLSETLWSHPSELAGIDMNDAMQLDLLRNHFPKFRHEYERIPTKPTEEETQFYLGNGPFDHADALGAYCMVRHFQPRLIIEVGSGFSSLLLGQAAAKNKSSQLICIEPFPRKFLRNGFPGLQSLIDKKVQDIDLEFFSQLESGDILFIDSSHTVKIGGDVNYLFLEVLPRLKPGVIVHVHDIFLPFEYRRDWVLDEFRFWTEQYLLQAFLTFNSEFEVLLANSYLHHYHQSDLKTAYPSLTSWGGGSFWMRRRPIAGSTPLQTENDTVASSKR
jgi:methyltransferase family protein